ncbi:serine/threonine-protein kinase [Candidatus Uabimicrobium amorphum]|uniref:Protein kinase n=1 Tax=Uabimicrobium amorphum TaxID=2596890 RepID=A0A5S9F4K8_UABAM|nr:PQQ-binding-like beta-propeller repeat protein [Candidatus Uabimicrobium amorphum]BBM84699.1 protein kinase [Candidatus Uabimicrobium amorphum]
MESTPTTQQKKFGKYVIEKELGRGGMGVVYKAYDLQLQRYVALKILLNVNQKSIRRLQNESVAMANIDHPNITRFYEFGSTPQPHFTMEFIEGTTLKALIAQKKIKQLFLINTLITVCDCLQEVHDKKILHRDLKPENIMVTKDGTPKIMDFGLAKFTNDETSNLSKTGDIVGTVHYMAPEQISGNVGMASDIYAVGATMYEALTFQKLFDGVSQANLIFQVLQVEPIPPREINPKISADLEEVCLKCLAKKPEMRYRNFRQLSTHLRKIKELRKSGASNTSKKLPSRKMVKLTDWIIRKRFPIIFALVLCISLCTNVYSFFAQNNYLQKSIAVISPNFLKGEKSKTVSLSTGTIALEISLPQGITEIQFLGKKIAWNQKETLFVQEIPLNFGENIIEITFLHKSGRYYKLQRKLKRPKEVNSVLFSKNTKRLRKAYNGNMSPLELKWKFSTSKSAVTFSPLVVKERILFGDTDGIFYCVDDSGKLMWKFTSSDSIYGYGSVFDNIVYFGNRSGDLYGLDIYTGQQLFHHSLGQPQRFSPLVKNDVIYVNTELENFYAIDLKTSQKIWRYKSHSDQEFYNSPAFYKDSIILPGYLGEMFCLDCKTGKERWKAKISERCYSSPMVIGDIIYVTAKDSLYAINAKKGNQLWRLAPTEKHRIGGTGVYDHRSNTMVIVDNEGYIFIIDLKKPEVKKIIRPKNDQEVWSSPQIVGNDIFIHSQNLFYSLNLATQRITNYHTIANKQDYYEYSSPTIHNKTLYVGSADGFLYAYKPRKITHYSFQVNIVSGRLIGRTYDGSFSYDPTQLTGKGTEKIPTQATKFVFHGKTFYKLGNLTFEDGKLRYLHLGGSNKDFNFGINSGFGRSRKHFLNSAEQFIFDEKNSFFAYTYKGRINGAGKVKYTPQR